MFNIKKKFEEFFKFNVYTKAKTAQPKEEMMSYKYSSANQQYHAFVTAKTKSLTL